MGTLREALEGAMDKQEAAATTEPVQDAPVAAVEAPTTLATNEPVIPIGETVEAKAERLRNEDGTYAKGTKPKVEATPKGAEKTGKPEAVAPTEAKAVGSPPPAPPAEVAKKTPYIPQSWKAPVRELAAKLPAEFHPILEEAGRQALEATRIIKDSAAARQLVETVNRTLSPYETIAKANGMDTMAYAGSVLQSAAALQVGTQAQKDALIANIITTYGGSLDGINAHLQGQAPPVQNQQQPVNIQAEFERLWDSRIRQSQESVASQKAQEFIGTQPEFLQDVWQDMVEILRVAEARGVDMDYSQAYDRACKLNEDVSKIQTQRQAAKAAQAQNASTQRSVEAASGVKTNPAAAPAGRPKDLRAALEYEADRQGMR